MTSNSTRSGIFAAFFCAAFAAALSAQTAQPAGIRINTFGEVFPHRAAVAPLAGLLPADHVVGGDEIVYTVEIHNASSRTIAGVAVTHPVPEHMLYVADTAAAPAADVAFSVDNGQHYGKPNELTVKLPDGSERAAAVADYTHIRWTLRNALRSNATAFARFRAVLKK